MGQLVSQSVKQLVNKSVTESVNESVKRVNQSMTVTQSVYQNDAVFHSVTLVIE